MRYRATRYTCEYPARITGPSGDFDAVIHDVNVSGARIVGVDGIREGDACTIWIGEKPVLATAAWVTGRAIGVGFQRKLTAQELSLVSSAQPARRTVPYRRDFGVVFAR